MIPAASVAEAPFRDVPPNHWAAQAVETLRQAGIVEAIRGGLQVQTTRGRNTNGNEGAMNRAPTGGIGQCFCWLGIDSGGPAWAHDVKDPVCRMTTDTDTTPYRETINGKTYYFCSDTCKAKFDKVAGLVCHAERSRLAAGQVRTYRLTLTAPPHPLPDRPSR